MPIDNELLQRLCDNDETLTSLNLRGSQLGASGATALAAGLEKNTTLTSLDLFSNQIGASGATALAAGLEKNTTLISLWLRSNQIEDALIQQNERLIKRNQEYPNHLQATACMQLKTGRILLYKATSTHNENNLFLALPLEIKEKIVSSVGENSLITNEQQRLIVNYAEGKIPPVKDKLSFFRITKCDKMRKPLNEDEIDAVEQKLAQLTV